MTKASVSETPRPLDIQPESLRHVQAALDDIRSGKMIILVDDEDRENEGDLCMAAERVTPEAINFMAMFGRGLICLTLTEEHIQRLDLPMMTAPGRGGPRLGTAFTVSIEASEGVTTGISAADRAQTVRVAINPNAKPSDVVVPGHTFPLVARRGGVLVRAGQTEGSVDLARLAGLNASGIVCEIINDDGTMARMPDLEVFAERHGLRIVTIADLIAYRLETERLVERVREADVLLDRTGTQWRALVFEAVLDRRQILALVKGEPTPEQPVLCRMHTGSTLGDLFSSTIAEGGRNLLEAIDVIEAAQCGVVVYLPPRGDLAAELSSLERREPSGPAAAQPSAPSEGSLRPHGGTLREYGLGAQVLRELGVRRLRLLTNNPKKIAGIQGYGLELCESLPLASVGRPGS
ncbi:MAG TPA: 3,4-dihydroxy-2-butanone-4-phosphate synthase [Polyangiaceae bacterium]|nr:3,4-dihydroxy-2-butanone-4-phosphate synthase [Polyangiaceae bacterium]